MLSRPQSVSVVALQVLGDLGISGIYWSTCYNTTALLEYQYTHFLHGDPWPFVTALLWEDIRACIRILAKHPILASRFGTTANLVGSALASAWTLDSVMSKAFEERLPDGHARLLGAGVVGFVSDAFLACLKTPPYFWIGPEVTRLFAAGQCPFLSNDQLKTANSVGGLSAVT